MLRFLFFLFFSSMLTNVKAQVHDVSIADNNGQQIHYKTAGEGIPVVLIFGFGMSLEEWFLLGYAEQLVEENFKIIAVEPRGHGRSTAPASPGDYKLKKISADIVTVLDHEQIDQAHIFGYSLGAKIALGVADYYPERIKSLVLGGFEISSEVDFSNDIVSSTLRLGASEWQSLWESLFDVPEPMGKRLGNVNTDALLALRKQEAEWNSFEPLLKKLEVPVFLFAGSECFTLEDMMKANELLKSSRFISLPGEDHFSLIPEMGPVVENAAEFLKKDP